MKRAILSVALGALILLGICGCEGGFLVPKAPDMNKIYCFSAEVSTPDGDYTADFLRNDTDDWSIDFTSPFTVANMVIQARSGNGLVSYDKTEVELNGQSWSTSVLSAVILALEAAANNPQALAVTTVDGKLQAAGIVQDMNFLMFFNAEGQICGLRIDALGLSANISGVEILGEIEKNDVIDVR